MKLRLPPLRLAMRDGSLKLGDFSPLPISLTTSSSRTSRQAIGFALGFATNDARAQSMYLGVNLRLRTFGQRGLASIGAGAIMRSVTRFPHLGEGDAIAADSDLLRGSNKFEIGWALIVNLGFGFGSIAGVKGESK